LLICSRRRASERALVISLAVASLALRGEAFGQVRSTIQAQARVVEAGPAWAASDAVSEALVAARALSISYEYLDGRVVFIDHGDGVDGISMPRVSIVGELPTTRTGLCSLDGERVAEPRRSDCLMGNSMSCSLFASSSVRALRVLPFAVVPEPDERRRLIVYVDYISN
jgi:hypothetical protein